MEEAAHPQAVVLFAVERAVSAISAFSDLLNLEGPMAAQGQRLERLLALSGTCAFNLLVVSCSSGPTGSSTTRDLDFLSCQAATFGWQPCSWL